MLDKSDFATTQLTSLETITVNAICNSISKLNRVPVSRRLESWKTDFSSLFDSLKKSSK
jgi:hypothetical protein